MVTTDNILQNVQAIFPKDKSSELVNVLERLGGRVTDFIRGNPIISTAAIGIGTTGLVAAAVTRIKKRRKAKLKPSKQRRKKARRVAKKGKRRKVKRKRARKISHRSPRHKGHKFVSFTTADGKKVKFLVRKKGSPSHKRKRRKR